MSKQARTLGSCHVVTGARCAPDSGEQVRVTGRCGVVTGAGLRRRCELDMGRQGGSVGSCRVVMGATPATQKAVYVKPHRRAVR